MQHHASADPAYPLYDARWEHDACGTGFIVQISGERSHALVEMALEALARLTHRGAQDADAETGDGAGVLTQLPTELFRAELAAQGITPPEAHALAVGMLFLPPRTRSPEELETSRQIIEQTLAELEIPLLLWRQPPLDESVLGSQARATLPTISQVLLACPDKLTPEAFDASLYNARRLIERRWLEAGLANAYVASLSRHTLVYKASWRLIRWRVSTSTWPILSIPALLLSFTSVTAPTPSRLGRWPSLSACWPTTARSIPCSVTVTGCGRARKL